jgi:hypothetical protein
MRHKKRRIQHLDVIITSLKTRLDVASVRVLFIAVGTPLAWGALRLGTCRRRSIELESKVRVKMACTRPTVRIIAFVEARRELNTACFQVNRF